jgi:uncharacterized membrane protein
MNKLMTVFMCFWTTPLLAASLKASADKLASETSRVAFSVGLFGLILASMYLMLGRNDAGEKMTKVLMGICVCMVAPAIMSFMRGLA